jgi:hypothetical protein
MVEWQFHEQCTKMAGSAHRTFRQLPEKCNGLLCGRDTVLQQNTKDMLCLHSTTIMVLRAMSFQSKVCDNNQMVRQSKYMMSTGRRTWSAYCA